MAFVGRSMNVFKYIWAELSTSENSGDWFEYAKSHMAHMVVGIISVTFVSALHLYTVGEFPSKAVMAVALGLFWAAYEWFTQGKQDNWGNFEDWVFIYLYGALPAILLFTELAAGDPRLYIDMHYVGPVYGIVFAHLVAGMAARIYREIRND